MELRGGDEGLGRVASLRSPRLAGEALRTGGESHSEPERSGLERLVSLLSPAHRASSSSDRLLFAAVSDQGKQRAGEGKECSVSMATQRAADVLSDVSVT